MTGYRIMNTLDDADEFLATYKGWQVHIERQFWPSDDEDDVQLPRSDFSGMAFYIRVGEIGTTIGSLYAGYWGNANHTLEDAVEEALIGSTLIEESQRRFGAAA